jgi:hypothetical protein
MLTAHDIALDRSLGRIVVATGLVLLYRPDCALVATVHPGFNDLVVAVNPHTHHAIVASWDNLSMHGAIMGPGAINIVDERTGRVLRRVWLPGKSGVPMSPVVDAQRNLIAVVNPIRKVVTPPGPPPIAVGSLALVCDRCPDSGTALGRLSVTRVAPLFENLQTVVCPTCLLLWSADLASTAAPCTRAAAVCRLIVPRGFYTCKHVVRTLSDAIVLETIHASS